MENQPQNIQKSKYKIYWDKQKEKGFWRYCLQEGLIWGILTGIFVEVFKVKTLTENFDIIQVAGFMLAGVFLYAPLVWFLNNRIVK
ncbi:MAG: hypothetical protein EAZ85_04860 [Bacteroidetes bacterium]|nr:MAG: hypothetical protein EAZ85_04860 [Bacteroidota bacterium]TAG85789.1 MAG: hypothetical protein EAZ20_14210 [Bacteroidota bacterium]